MSMAKRTLVVVFIFGYNRISIYFIFPLCVAVPLHLSPPPLYTSMPTTRGRYFYHHECSSQSYFSFFNTRSSREICEIRAGCEGGAYAATAVSVTGTVCENDVCKGNRKGREGGEERRLVLSPTHLLFIQIEYFVFACMTVCLHVCVCVYVAVCTYFSLFVCAFS